VNGHPSPEGAGRPPEQSLPVEDGKDPGPSSEDLRRSERTMILVRGIGALFAAYQVLVYDTQPYPSAAYRNMGLALAGVLALGDLAIWLAQKRLRALPHVRAIALAGLALDIAVASGFVWLFAFDQTSALWVVLFILPLEGAILFQLSGALGAWLVITLIYIGREVWGSSRFEYELQWSSVSFRMGVGLLITLVGGLMARDLTQQRTRLRAALAQVRRVDRLRASLVDTMAHDVRNPLTAIRGAIKTVLGQGDRIDQQTKAELLSGADLQAGRLERLAADLLDLARLERGRLDLSLQEVKLREAVETALSFADDQGRYEVRIDPSITVRADPGRLEQIVVNLAANALRYGKPPFLAEAGVSNGDVRLELRDHGPGVRPEETAMLFEPFRSEPSRESVGLGLAIVKALSEAHGGTVSYEPNTPRGACFSVRLPVAGPSPSAR
jgi:signal transduction histidine kinase